MSNIFLGSEYKDFFSELKNKISAAKYQAARSVNKQLILLYHQIGQDILEQQATHGWGSKIIDKLSKDLTNAFPEMKGFSTRNLKYMRIFAKTYPDFEFVQEVLAQLSWYHQITLIDKIKDRQERLFYIGQAIENSWSRNIMLMQIEQNLFKRQGKAISNFKERLSPLQSDLANQTLKDPYIFDFLSIGAKAHEREVEKALITHIEKFMMELGAGFAFVGRQYHLEVANEDFYLDLLFYHLKLRCFVVIELKTGKFKPEYVGKMNFYLSAVDSQIKHPDDHPSIGLILCKSKNEVMAEYALRDTTKAIGLSEYRIAEELPENIKTELPSIDELEAALSEDLSK